MLQKIDPHLCLNMLIIFLKLLIYETCAIYLIKINKLIIIKWNKISTTPRIQRKNNKPKFLKDNRMKITSKEKLI